MIFPFTCIMNLSINSCILPKQLKIARFVPLFKTVEQDIFSNYRVMSVLLAFSTIQGRVMYNRL